MFKRIAVFVSLISSLSAIAGCATVKAAATPADTKPVPSLVEPVTSEKGLYLGDQAYYDFNHYASKHDATRLVDNAMDWEVVEVAAIILAAHISKSKALNYDTYASDRQLYDKLLMSASTLAITEATYLYNVYGWCKSNRHENKKARAK